MEHDPKKAKADNDSFLNSAEYANYFCEYAKIYHQKDMLDDRLRMEAYHSAIFKNADCFRNKVVLDVGSGTAILSMWAAQAGASMVYAVEATPMAVLSRKIINANGLQDRVTVLQSKLEDIELPEKVDIIISEWMGYLLLRESMLDSVLYARDRWLKPGGQLYPSHASLSWGALRKVEGVNGQCYEDNVTQLNADIQEWQHFVTRTKASFGIDMGVLTENFRMEHIEYRLQQAEYHNLIPSQVVGTAENVTTIDLNTVTIEEIKDIQQNFKIVISNGGGVTALGCWFATDFRGSEQNPTKVVVTLDTSPYAGETHWGQQVFFIPTMYLDKNAEMNVNAIIQPDPVNPRMVTCELGLMCKNYVVQSKKYAIL